METHLQRIYVFAWLASSVAGVSIALLALTPEGNFHSYFFLGIDSFYHASRVLDVLNGISFYEWDTRGYYPDGEWVSWPWAYDYVLIGLSRLFLTLGGHDPVSLLVLIPSLFMAVNTGIIGLLCWRLKLRPALATYCMLAFAILPLNLQLHLAGRIDHHFAELTFVLLTTYLLVGWAQVPESGNRAMLFGASLGMSLGVNNGMFLLAFPILVYAGLRWLMERPMPLKSSWSFAIGLLMTTLFLCVFSLPFQAFEFRYDLLSWFHLYTGFCTAGFVILLARFPRTISGAAGLVLAGLILGAPLLGSVISGVSYISANNFSPMETETIFSMNLPSLMVLYSPALFVAPVAIIILLYLGSREQGGLLAVAICAALGFTMLVTQHRFALFGSMALFVPLALVIESVIESVFARRVSEGAPETDSGTVLGIASGTAFGSARAIALNLLLIVALTFQAYFTYLSLPHQRLTVWNPEYLENYSLLLTLAELCNEDPGLALVHPNQGHYVLYHTRCAVTANNMTLTDRQLAARRKTHEYLLMSPEALLRALPEVKYIILTRYDGARAIERPEAVIANQQGLYGALMNASQESLPVGFELLGTMMTSRGDEPFPLSRLFRVHTEVDLD